MAIYNIGEAGSQYQKLSDIDWGSLQPGDVVRVHWKPEAYNERLLLDIQGTEDNPIVIEGVPGPNGEMPVLDADGATTPTQFSDFNITWRQNLGGSIYIGPKNSYPDASEIPQHIIIRGFEITGAGQGNTIYDTDGNPHTHAGQAGVYIKGGDNITIEGNHIHHNGAGIFSNSNHDYEITENLVIKGNTFELNGVVGNYLYHHVYTEGVNTTVDGNVFLEKVAGDLGSLLKMRDVGVVVSNNEFGSSPGHIIDLGDVQSDAMVALGLHQSADFYHSNQIVGNTIVAATGNIFFGGDSLGKETDDGLGAGTYRQTLEFHNNSVTFASDRGDQWRLGILRAPSTDQTFNVSGNDFIATSETDGALATNFALMASGGNLNISGTNTATSNIALWADNSPQNGAVTGWDTVTVTDGSGGGDAGDPDTDPADGGDDPDTGDGDGNSDGGGNSDDPDPGDGDGNGDGNTDDPVDPPADPPSGPSNAADLLFGTTAGDSMNALGGDDTVYAEDGADTVYGGTGSDFLNGDGGNDLLAGDDGDDVLHGGAGDDTAYGGAGDDRVAGNAGNDNLSGNSGADTLLGGDGDDTLSGRDGADMLFGNAGNDKVFGGAGDDVVFAEDGDDTIYADAGDDYAAGGGGTDFISGDAGDDTLHGGADNDYLDGGWGDDSLNGDAGDDRVSGRDGDDALSGGDGNDTVLGGSGADTLIGDGGNDQLTGDAGDDVLNGGAGADTLAGGSGADTFVFADTGSTDFVWDFNAAQGDQIDLSSLLSGYDPATDDIADFIRLDQYGWKHATLSVDVDGGGDSFVPIAILGYGKDLTLADLMNDGSLIL